MTTFRTELIVELLDGLLSRLPDIQEYKGEGICVSGFVSAIARKWPAPLNPQDEKGLEALSLKVDITKKVWTAYDVDWGKPMVSLPLAPPFYLLLIAVLMAYSLSAENSPKEKGKGLKRINTALNALDLCEDNNIQGEPEKLAACAHSLIEAILDE